MPTNVSEVTQQLIEIVRDNSGLRDVWIQGEISEIIPPQRGVLNFTLEGNGQKIECVIFPDRAPLQESLPPVGSNVPVNGQIYVHGAISEYRFRVTDIHRTGVPFPTPCVSINDLTGKLKDTLNQVSPVEVQGEIAKVFVTTAGYTILKLKDVTTDGRVNKVIECALLPGIAPPFRLQQGNRITVSGKFGIFANASAYRIEIDDGNNIQPMAVAAPLNECQGCHQCFRNLQDQLCHVCYYARLTYEGIVVGAVQRYFDAPRFASFSTKRELEIQFGGGIRGRADIALLNSGGRPEAIAECKRIENDNRSDGIEQLISYLSGSGAKLGLFADDTDPCQWTFLKKKNDEENDYDEIARSQFEKALGVEPVAEIPPTKTQLEIVHGNIIEAEVDAIVNAADPNLTRGSGVDGAIRDAGGKEIERKCQEIFDRKGVRPPGKAVITTGGNLPARYVIHAVGPIYQGGQFGEAKLLARCYKNSLRLAVKNGIRSIAFPAISTGNFRYPIEPAAHVALTAVKEFVEQAHQNNEMVPERIQFVLFDEEAYACYVKKLSNLGVGLSCQIG